MINVKTLVDILALRDYTSIEDKSHEYYDTTSRLLILFMQAEKATMTGDKQEIYFCLVEMDFLFDFIISEFVVYNT